MKKIWVYNVSSPAYLVFPKIIELIFLIFNKCIKKESYYISLISPLVKKFLVHIY